MLYAPLSCISMSRDPARMMNEQPLLYLWSSLKSAAVWRHPKRGGEMVLGIVAMDPHVFDSRRAVLIVPCMHTILPICRAQSVPEL